MHEIAGTVQCSTVQCSAVQSSARKDRNLLTPTYDDMSSGFMSTIVPCDVLSQTCDIRTVSRGAFRNPPSALHCTAIQKSGPKWENVWKTKDGRPFPFPIFVVADTVKADLSSIHFSKSCSILGHSQGLARL